MMLYVLKCKCESVEWDKDRKCMSCGKKFRNKYNLTDEHALVQYRYLELRNGEHFFNPLKDRRLFANSDRPLYVLQCKCGCVEFDDKRRCLHCREKFKNNEFRNKYMVVRMDWLNEDNEGKLTYTFDPKTKKPVINDKAPNKLF